MASIAATAPLPTQAAKFSPTISSVRRVREIRNLPNGTYQGRWKEHTITIASGLDESIEIVTAGDYTIEERQCVVRVTGPRNVIVQL